MISVEGSIPRESDLVERNARFRRDSFETQLHVNFRTVQRYGDTKQEQAGQENSCGNSEVK